MKRLYLVRHAKSSWRDPELDDFDRPLNKRGKRDAPFMGQRLSDADIQPDLIISSPAKRAAKTAKVIAAKIGYPAKHIQWRESLYGAGTLTLLQILYEIEDSVRQLMLVGHNPGLTLLAECLTGESVYNIPTAGVFAVDLTITSWAQAREGCGALVFFDYPKKHTERLD
ncbi:MAG: histidine phosphatase family protein [Candidatus Aminicenantaceae bacterium]